jgi:uncharacterized surface protein with fasciclin (FAS1) repeats
MLTPPNGGRPRHVKGEEYESQASSSASAEASLIMGMVVLGMPRTASAQGEKDIVETAAAAGSFKTLVAAVQAAGLADTLKGAGPFTVFAPTDEAFAKLPAGTVDTLLKPKIRPSCSRSSPTMWCRAG